MLASLTPALAWTLGGIFALLVVATLAVWLLRRARPGVDRRELVLRVRSWWIMATIFAVAIALSRTVSLVFLGLVSYLALKEYFSLIPTRRADRRVLFWAYLSIPIQYYWVAIEWYGMFIIFIPVYVFLFLPLRMLLVGRTAGFLQAAGTIHWGLMTAVFSLSHAAFLLTLPWEFSPAAGGAGLLLYLVLLTQLNDVAQYVSGKMLGRSPVVPQVSPGKTREGLAGGVATTALLAVALAPLLTPFSPLQAAGVGAGLSLAGFVGDVTISALKRDLGIKDSGELIPGHGGILDRVDSLTYTAPLFFHYVWYLY